MFDLFGLGPTREDLLAVDTHHAVNAVTLYMLLIEKGIITDEELIATRAKAIAFVDQLRAKQRDEAQAEFDKEHPGLQKLFGKLTGHTPNPAE